MKIFISLEQITDQNLAHATTAAVMSSNIKFQELPEFRLDNAFIEASRSKSPQKLTEEISLRYTKIQIQETEVNLDDPFFQEYAHSASSILEVVKLRDKYIFDHCQCNFFSVKELM